MKPYPEVITSAELEGAAATMTEVNLTWYPEWEEPWPQRTWHQQVWPA